MEAISDLPMLHDIDADYSPTFGTAVSRLPGSVPATGVDDPLLTYSSQRPDGLGQTASTV
jgi:hypothetical protein